jgi:hypothetical protein
VRLSSTRVNLEGTNLLGMIETAVASAVLDYNHRVNVNVTIDVETIVKWMTVHLPLTMVGTRCLASITMSEAPHQHIWAVGTVAMSRLGARRPVHAVCVTNLLQLPARQGTCSDPLDLADLRKIQITAD